jgi:hypothetical protein
VVAAADGAVTVVYAVTEDGRLEARRQDAPGSTLDSPVQVGAGLDWSSFQTFLVPRVGFLWAGSADVRTFRHVGWADGGETLVEGPVAFASPNGWPALGELVLTGLDGNGRAEAIFASTHWRVWLQSDGRPVAYSSGHLPVHVPTALGGREGGLYAVVDGAVARLRQPPHPPIPPELKYTCKANPKGWQIATSLPGGWSTVVVPERASTTEEWPFVAPLRNGIGRCPDDVSPYEWQ